MSESQDLNLADLNYTFQTTKTETAATLLKERAGDRRYLASLLRDHAGTPIVSSWQQHRRDDIDDLLDYYSLLEIAAIVGHIPAVFPDNLKRQIFPKLRLPSMRLYYEQYYIQKLPTLLRLRLEGRHALAVEPDSTTTAAYAQLADLAASVRGNEEMNDLLALLDDYVIDGRGWQDLEKLLADPKKYVKHVTSNSPDDDILASAAIGFQGFLSFCRDFHELLRQVERQPLVLCQGQKFGLA